MEELEHHFSCSSCGAPISVLIDWSEEGQEERIEDCEVCCRPMLITYSVHSGSLQSFDATSAY